MELRSCGHQHFIQAIKDGSIKKILNVHRGRPALSFKNLTDIYSSLMLDNINPKVERSCIAETEKRTVKTEPDTSACNADESDQEVNCVLEDCSFSNLTLKQIQNRCRTKKRKHLQGLDVSQRKMKLEASSSLEHCVESHMAEDDSEFTETLSSWRSKLSKNRKAKKKKCINDHVSTVTHEVTSVVKSEVVQNTQEFPSSRANSAAIVEVKSEVPEIDCSDHLMMLCSVSNRFQACHWPENSLEIVAIGETESSRECMLDYAFDYEWNEHAEIMPLQIMWPNNTNISASDSELSSDQYLSLPAIQFESEECIIQPDHHLISPKAIDLVEDQKIDTYYNELHGDTQVTLPITVEDLGNESDGGFFIDCNKDEFTSDAKDQTKLGTVIEHSFNPDGYQEGCSSDDSPESEEKKLFASLNVDEERCANEATDELVSWDGCKASSKLHHPQRLLSTRKAISPSSQIRLCKAMQSIALRDKDTMKCKGKLNFDEQTDKEKQGNTEGVNKITEAPFTKRCNKIRMIPGPVKRVSHPQGVQKSSLPLRSAARISTGQISMKSCAKSAISFSKQQMYDAECLTMKLTNELKSMKDIMADMMRSELCLTTSLRYKLNEARMAVKNATRAEECAKRSLNMMARDCSRFCKLMQLVDEGPPASNDVAPKKSKKIAFADEAGGRLCQVRFYQDEEGSC